MNYLLLNIRLFSLLMVTAIVAVSWSVLAVFSLDKKKIASLSHQLCSEYFIAKTSQASLLDGLEEEDLKKLQFTFNDNGYSVTVSMLNFFSQTSIYRKGSGCYLAGDLNPVLIAASTSQPEINRVETDTVVRIFPELAQILASESRNNGKAFIVWYDGKIITENYGFGYDKDTLIQGYDLGNLLPYILVDQLFTEGKLSVSTKYLFPQWQYDHRKNIPLRSLLSPEIDFQIQHSQALFPMQHYQSAFFRKGSLTPFIPSVYPDRTKQDASQYSPIKADLLGAYLSYFLSNWTLSMNYYIDDQIAKPINANPFQIQMDAKGNWMPRSTYATARDWLKLGVLLASNGNIDNKRVISKQTAEDLTGYDSPTNTLFIEKIDGFTIEDQNDFTLIRGTYGQILAYSPSLKVAVIKLANNNKAFQEEQVFNYSLSQIRQYINRIRIETKRKRLIRQQNSNQVIQDIEE